MNVMERIRSTQVELLPAGAADLPALSELYVQMYDAHGAKITSGEALAKLTLMLKAPNQKGLVFRRGDLLLGFVIWADLGDHIFIRDYLIDATHRGRGLGAALFARLRAEVLPQDRPLRLEVSADHAHGFWKSQGFITWSSGMRTDALKEHH